VSAKKTYVPLYEGKMIWQFDHRYGTFEGYTERPSSSQIKTPTPAQYANPHYTVTPWNWVEQEEVENRLAGWNHQWLIGFRDIARATDERTFIASVIPKVGVGHTMPLFMARLAARPEEHALLLGVMNSLVFDFIIRLKIGGTHLTFFNLRQIPTIPTLVLRESCDHRLVMQLIELIYTSYDLQPFAQDCGYDGPPFPWDEERRALLRAELDAYYAHLYGLNRDELRYILDPQDVYGPDFPGETFRVLKDKEIRQYGEYRTKRLTLEAWDRLFGKGA
jgi:hypothetical protein